MLETLDGSAVRAWGRTGLAALGRAREEIDAINVFPVADADTGTNLFLTFEAGYAALDSLDPAGDAGAEGAARTLAAFADGALRGALGNSGVILSQLLRGLADQVGTAARDGLQADARVLAAAFGVAADLAWQAVAAPAEGTMLTVAREAAKAAAAVVARSEANGTGAASGPGAGSDSGSDSELGSSPGPGSATQEPTFAEVAEAARDAADAALERTPEQLGVLREAGVVDAGARGLCVLFEVLAALVGGYDPQRAVRSRRIRNRHPAPYAVDAGQRAAEPPAAPGTNGTPAFEVIYLFDAAAEQAAHLRRELENLCRDGGGDSLVIAGGEGCYRVHVHVNQPGPAIEAAIRLGRPYDLRVASLAECGIEAAPSRADSADTATAASSIDGSTAVRTDAATATATATSTATATAGADTLDTDPGPRHAAPHGLITSRRRPAPGRAVLAAAPGPGIARLFAREGAIPVACGPSRPPTSVQLTRAVAQAGVEEIVVLVNDAEGLAAASAAAEQVHRAGTGVRVAVVPSKAVVQGIAALAVHEPNRRFDADIVAMTAAAGATRYGALQIAQDDAWTMAGVCHAGDVLGLIEDDVALIAASVDEAAFVLIDRMVSAGGEMVTLVTGEGLDPAAAEELVEAVTARVHARRLEVDVIVYDGGQSGWPLLIGVE